MNSKLVQVLLSTYNGESYIVEQLKSISLQTHENISVLIRDDGSIDDTLQLIEDFSKSCETPIQVLRSENCGSSLSFYQLLSYSHAEYVMFCDQDDVWLPDKVENTLKLIDNSISTTPQGVFTDLTVTDENLNVLSSSLLFDVQKMNPKFLLKNPIRMIAQNPVAGCTLLLNSAARQTILNYGKVPEGLIHDHWFSSIVSLNGTLHFLEESTLLYRQHGNNQVGKVAVNTSYLISKIFGVKNTIMHDYTLLKSLGVLRTGFLFRYLKEKFF